jgi:3-deoxy-manno-octulosonate cytidylyltransferase (CMP-KDO synthetase)
MKSETSDSRVLGVIPARWGSTRFPGKSLALVAGKPLVCRVVEQVLKAQRLDRVIVATDDERIAQAVKRLDVTVAMTRPDHPSGTDRVAEAVEAEAGEIVINIQGDEPLIDPSLIDRLVVEMQKDAAWDMATAAAPIRDRRELDADTVVKVVWAAEHRALYFSRFAIPFVRGEDPLATPGLHWRHVGIYAYRRSFLARLVATSPTALEQAEKLEQLRALHIGGRIVVIETDEPGIGIDTPGDVERVEALIRQRAEERK